ncbi:unnamed protein product [Angiostrongylus costaricensis]|uniref:non-specific serine/threonine protein kinase n=1 Tax=Angiostrongylus costaricensis TaxID=334426 RepID=A0A158PJF2_ANGCS|nr:unnamed protein product [Angiostrongylus costaricensis]
MLAEDKVDFKGFTQGKIIGGRWKVIGKLGEGAMGAVYKVLDKNRRNFYAAMKVEDDLFEGGVLKLEVHVLQQLQKMKGTVKLYDSGRRQNYCFMVITLCDKDLMTLKREHGGAFSELTILRLAISTLFAIKQVHEIGYVHRDVKPSNCMIGKYGRDRRMIYLIDFGMARSFVAKDKNGKLAIRKPRDGDQLFRGTPRYCSLNTHHRKEQGRVDDLWCWFYTIIELHVGLPWRGLSDERKISTAKENCSPGNLLKGCPNEFGKIHDYLKTLKYEDRPDYYGLFSEIIGGRWKVIEKLGEGGMGAIYKVADRNRKNFFAAMKVENELSEGGVLKLEVHLLQKLQKMKGTMKLYDSGNRRRYCFMVMTLCDKDLMTLRREYGGRPFSESTTLRIAISTLHAIKQLHEIGYIHRDIKPGNFMIGKFGRDRRTVYLIDFGDFSGMVRSFVGRDEKGSLAIKKPRSGNQLFRGTPRYCSLNTHYGKEQARMFLFLLKTNEFLKICYGQGRVDDLWCWLHTVIELRTVLPWWHLTNEREIMVAKENCSPQVLLEVLYRIDPNFTKLVPVFFKQTALQTCPTEFFKIRQYLETLKYEDRPDYHGLFSECAAGLKRVNGSFLDPYEWEGPEEDVCTALSISESCKNGKPLSKAKLAIKIYPFASAAAFKQNILKL